MGNRKEIHVVPNSNRGGWDAKRNNAERSSKHFETKQDAMTWARNRARNDGAELIPHKKDGTKSRFNPQFTFTFNRRIYRWNNGWKVYIVTEHKHLSAK